MLQEVHLFEKKNIRKNKKIQKEQGSITLFVLISMLFFMIILVGLFTNVSNKVSKQEKEINRIQQSYRQEDINEIYNEKYEQKHNNI